MVNGHWRESVFDTELMTPYLDGGVANPLSIVTLASFQGRGLRGRGPGSRRRLRAPGVVAHPPPRRHPVPCGGETTS